MGKYTVTEGQNLYDVALHLTGSIEGIVDLLICNPALSLADTLHSGDELFYTDDFVINADVVARYRREQIVPAGGERNVPSIRLATAVCGSRWKPHKSLRLSPFPAAVPPKSTGATTPRWNP